MGVEVRGRKLGTLGDVGIFSFGRGKNITCGSGGAILTQSPAIAAAIAARYDDVPPPACRDVLEDVVALFVMALFIRPRLYWIPAALPFLRLGETRFPDDVPIRRLGGVRAALLRGWRERLARSNAARAERAAFYGERLAPVTRGRHPYLRLPLLAPSAQAKQTMHAVSRTRGLGLSAAYPTPVSDIPRIRSAFSGQRFPSAEQVAARLLTLPTHDWVTRRDRQAIAELCAGCRLS
jgi:dTDP-4-amino-4,6-dideoxygalactose transaminase